ncbi:MAG: peptide chain release factor N(5)-glutamine methyltransferase [Bacteroidales bacterium]|nr:peptide chain release factor N(5)-glutamine methyltransferase [Bacteroidales bacterium]
MNTRNIRFKSNRVRDIITLFHEKLDSMYGGGEVVVFLDMLFEAFLGWDKVRLLTSKEQTIDQSDLLRFHWALEDLKQCRPIQHIIGYTDFCGCRITVSPDVLIPRPETEEIVQWCISKFSIFNSQFSILDLCTGSGCIAIALKKTFPQAEVTAVDVSAAALEIARQNAQNNGTDVHFIQADILNGASHLSPLTFHLIVSNPPYVRESERAQIQRNVLDYDPELALFVPDDDPLRFYKAIATIAKERLAADGLLVVEINEVLAEETCALLKDYGFTPEVHSDFRGKPRWISANLNP